MKKNIFMIPFILGVCVLCVFLILRAIESHDLAITTSSIDNMSTHGINENATPSQPQSTLSSILPSPKPTEGLIQPSATPLPTTEVLSYVHPSLEQYQKGDTRIKIVAVGDILLGRGVESRLKREGKDYKYPFLQVAEILKEGDIVFGNLEEPITSRANSLTGIKQGGKYVLKNEVKAIEGLSFAGFNLFSLANNHILDYYKEGLFDTTDILDKHGIAYSGAGKNIEDARKPAIIEKNGVKIGMLSYTDMSEVLYKGNPPITFIAGPNKAGVAPRPLKFNDSLKSDIDNVRDKVDLVVVSLHWGVEESFTVLDSQREFAHSLLDNGVDIILGHHPHQFQGIEIYKGKPIFYSLGNFIFDQNDPENQETFIMNMEYKNNKLVALHGTPVRTVNKTQIVPQSGDGAKGMLERQVKLCKELNSACHIEGDKLIFDLDIIK